MRASTRNTTLALVIALTALGAAANPAEGARPGRASASRPSAGAAGDATPSRAVGRASYGHFRGSRHGYYGYHRGHYPYAFADYGWPFAHYGWWGWGWPYGPYSGWPYHPHGPVPPGAGSEAELGAVETHVRPKRAEVRVDGETVGQARDYSGRWDRLWLNEGPHTVELAAPGYRTLRRDIRVRPGGTLVLVERLARGEGLDPRSSAPPARERAADGPRSAAADRSPEPARRPRDSASEPAASGLRRGLLRLEVRPADAAVYLDGEFLARAGELSRLHGALPVAVGVHTVEVVRPGYLSRSLEVEVSAEQAQRVEIALERRDRGPETRP